MAMTCAARRDCPGCNADLAAPLATVHLSTRTSAACLAAVTHRQALVTDFLLSACRRTADGQLTEAAKRGQYANVDNCFWKDLTTTLVSTMY